MEKYKIRHITTSGKEYISYGYGDSYNSLSPDVIADEIVSNIQSFLITEEKKYYYDFDPADKMHEFQWMDSPVSLKVLYIDLEEERLMLISENGGTKDTYGEDLITFDLTSLEEFLKNGKRAS